MDKKTLDSYIRVNHAGEFGAVRIYQGQIDALGDNPIIQEMLSQEKEHLSAFEEEMRTRKIRPTAFLPLWSVLGYGLGFISGKIGKSAAMACTQAVEEVIDEHYLTQLKTLDQQENLLKEKISKFRDDEIHHKDIALDQGAKDAPLYTLFAAGVRAATLLAIGISKKI